MMKARLRFTPRKISSVAALICVVLILSGPAQSRIILIRSGITPLHKSWGRIDQVISLPAGGFAVRDSDFYNEAAQALEIYDQRGNFIRKIGSFGRSPGQYFRLKTIALAGDSSLWVVDVAGRLSRFSQDGQLLNTQLIQQPGFNIHGLALDEVHGQFYLSGCVATNYYVDRGCRLVHQYGLNDGVYHQSFVETDPQAIEKHLFPLEEHLIDIDNQGHIYAVDVPIWKVSRLDPPSGRVQDFPIKSRVASAVAALPTGQDTASNKAAYDNAFLVDQVLAVDHYVVVSIRRPQGAGYILQVLSDAGSQVVIDFNSPGRLVGKSKNGHLYFARKAGNEFEIAEYQLAAHALGR